METTKIEFTRISSDTNGKPRYVCHFLNLINDGDKAQADAKNGDTFGIETLYRLALNKAAKIGGKKYHNKQYGGGIVFQSNNIADTDRRILELKEVNTNFVKLFTDKQHKQVSKAIFNHFATHTYKRINNHGDTPIKFNVLSMKQLDDTMGLAYTSSGDYAGLWVCNGGYVMATNTHHFIGFAINTDNEVIAIAEDENENPLYIQL